MGIVSEFREFAIKGNVIDLAVGVVIGAAFNSVVKSLVDNVVMPPLGALSGGLDFSDRYINLSGGSYESLAAAQEAGAATINYGMFLNDIVSFLIVAWAVFLVIRQFNRLKRKPAQDTTPTMKSCPFCDSDISLKASRCPACTSQLAGA